MLSKLEAISQQTKKEAKMKEQIDTLQDTMKQMQGFMDDQNKVIASTSLNVTLIICES